MELFDYLMAKKGHNTSTRGDLFSYLLGKKASGGSGTYTTFSGTSLNISNTIKAKIKNFMLNSSDLTQSGTPTPDASQDIRVITGSNNIKITDGVEEQNYPISLEILEYCKIGDYEDQIFKNTTDSEFYDNTLELNEWYLKKNINKTVITNENVDIINGFGTVNNHPRVLINKGALGYKTDWLTHLFVINTYKEVTSTGSAISGTFATNFVQNSVSLVNDNFTSLEEAKTQLIGTVIYNPLATPQYIHISETDYPTLRNQLENIYNNAQSYNGQTNITQTNEDLPFNISIDVKVKTE